MRLLGLIALAGCGRIGFDEIEGPTGLPLAAEASTARANFNSNVTIVASGGTPPYSYAVDVGSINEAGVYRSTSRPSAATITVTDDDGAIVTVPIETGGIALFGVGGYTTTGSFSEVYR